MYRIERSSLVVVYKNVIEEAICMQAIDKTAKLLKTSARAARSSFCFLFSFWLFLLSLSFDADEQY